MILMLLPVQHELPILRRRHCIERNKARSQFLQVL